MEIEPYYVVDTHALLWHLTNDPRMSAKAVAIFEAAQRGQTQLIVSAITIAELYYADQKKRYFQDFTQTYRQLLNDPAFQFVPFKVQDVFDFIQDAAVPEMHDRMIVGLARRLGLPLITSDQSIIDANLVEIAW